MKVAHYTLLAPWQALLGQQLRQALANEELALHYQPQYNIHAVKIEAFEALLRWENSVFGTVAPTLLISIAETVGLIVPVGEWVLRTACRFIAKIYRKGFTDCRIAVNVSTAQLLQKNFAGQVFAILAEVGLPASCLELELTETLPLDSLEFLNAQFKLLQAKGVRIALDDFGTGYASLSCLNQLQVDILKIDKSFIDGILDRKVSIALTKSIIDIGRQLDLKVIAEGVESQAQADCLLAWGCDTIQGFFYSKPVAEKEAAAMVEYGNDRYYGIKRCRPS
jgi:EAL domain-containing protein (putative c-di-GMP-specific phosphodiesterase class I)